MFYWIYDLPAWTVAFLFAAVFIGVNWFGAIFIRPFLRVFFRGQDGTNDIVGYILSLYSVMYGLLLGMLAIGTYQSLLAAQEIADKEAASIAALYRDVGAYPEPTGSTLQTLLKDYTRHIIDEDWPLQRKGVIPAGGTQRINVFHSQLIKFEPQTKGQEALHGEALHQFNQLVSLRRLRLSSVSSGGIPSIMWYTVVTGAVICMVFIWLFNMSFIAQLILGGLASFAIATMICLSALMDNPFRGELSVSPAAFQIVYDQLMDNK